jgi:hypothetical protein
MLNERIRNGNLLPSSPRIPAINAAIVFEAEPIVPH